MPGSRHHGRFEEYCFGPALIPVAVLAVTAIGTGVAAYSSVQSSAAQSASAAYQAQVASNNAKVAASNAAAATQAGVADEQQNALKTRAEVGGELADQASSGLDVNSGSAVNVRSSASSLGELSGLTIVNNAARTAYGYDTDSAQFTGQAGLDTAESTQATTAGEIGVGSSIIGGAGSIGGNLMSNYQKTGSYLGNVNISS